MAIEYSLWMYGKDFDHDNYEGPLYGRKEPIKSNISLLHAGMKVRMDGLILEIESVELNLEYAEPWNSLIDIDDKVEIDVHVKTDEQFESWLQEIGEEGSNGWIDIHFEKGK